MPRTRVQPTDRAAITSLTKPVPSGCFRLCPFLTAVASSYPSTTNSRAEEQWQLLQHSWGECFSSPNIQSGGKSPPIAIAWLRNTSQTASDEAHQMLIFPAQFAGKNFAAAGKPAFISRQRTTWPPSTNKKEVLFPPARGPPKGCMSDPRELSRGKFIALQLPIYPFAPGFLAISVVLPTNHNAIDFRSFFGPFICACRGCASPDAPTENMSAKLSLNTNHLFNLVPLV